MLSLGYVLRRDNSQRKRVIGLLAFEGQWNCCEASVWTSKVLDTPLVGVKADRALQHVECVKMEKGHVNIRADC
jgi:hypothetical protein